MILLYIIVASVLVMFMSLIGIVTVNRTFRAWTERNLRYLTTAATGVFIVVAYNLVAETLHSSFSLSRLLLAMLIGVIIALLVDYLLPDSHHHHDIHDTEHTHSKAGARRIILSDSIHNITDGFLVATSFLIDVRLGILTTVGILVHEVAQEISEFFVLKSAGYTTKQALKINFFTASTIIIGAVFAYGIASTADNIIGLLLAVASGIIIYTIIRDLIPHSYAAAKHDKSYVRHIAAAFIGAVAVTGLTMLSADTHVHGPSENYEHHDHHEDEHDHEDEHHHE